MKTPCTLTSRVCASSSCIMPLMDFTRAWRLLGTRLLPRLSDDFTVRPVPRRENHATAIPRMQKLLPRVPQGKCKTVFLVTFVSDTGNRRYLACAFLRDAKM